MRFLSSCLITGVLGLGCGGDDTTGGSGSAGSGGGSSPTGGAGATGGGGAGGGGAGSGGEAAMIPDCGPGMDQWVEPTSLPGGAGADIGTPETAWQVGTATNANPYVQANISAVTGSAFFVFCAGPALDEITIFLNSVDGNEFGVIHVHEGTGGVFGPEVAPTSIDAAGGTWPLQPGATYVFEVANEPGSFF